VATANGSMNERQNMIDNIEALVKLREPFPPNLISKLPKETRKQIDDRKADNKWMVWKCDVCGGAHHKNAVHLDYVGHAALTDRLLDTDIVWTWEPLAFAQREAAKHFLDNRIAPLNPVP